MAAYRRPILRNLFDDSPTPHIAHPPRTHRRDFYVATDGSYRADGSGGLGVVIETRTGEQVCRIAVPDQVPDNNVAEYRALHLGLDVLATKTNSYARVGILLDHDELAANVNRLTLANKSPDASSPHPIRIPAASSNHWRGIQARLAGFSEVRAAQIDSNDNPAHPLANAADQYVNRPDLSTNSPSVHDVGTSTGDDRYPPPSRADRERTFDPSASD